MSEMRSQRMPFVHEVRRHEDRDALLARQIDQQLPEAVAGDRIDARRRLVQDQDLRLVQDGDGQREPLAQPHRQVLGQRVEMRAEPESLDQLLDARLRLLGRQVIEARVQDQVLADGQLAVERERLRHVAEVLADLHAAGFDGAAEERRASPRWAAAARSASSWSWTCRSRWSRGSRRSRRARSTGVTWSTAVKSPKRRVRPLASMAISALPAARGGMVSSVWPLRFSSGSRAMKHCSRSFVPVRSISSAGVPVASTRPGVHRHDPVPLLRLVHVGGGDDDAHARAARRGCRR